MKCSGQVFSQIRIIAQEQQIAVGIGRQAVVWHQIPMLTQKGERQQRVLVEVDVERRVCLQGHQFARQPRLVGEFDQVLAAFVLLDLRGAFQKRVEIAIFLEQLRRRLRSDAWHARHIVGRIAVERLKVDHLFRADTEFLDHLGDADLLLGAALCLITTSGVRIWLLRRSDSGRAAPGWQRQWDAVLWGQPLIYALLAILTLLRPEAPTLPAWLLLTASSLLIAAVPVRADASNRLWRVALSSSLPVLVATHLSVHGWPKDPIALLINAALVLCAMLLVLRLRRSAAPSTRSSSPRRQHP